jgi:hypothetical protein
VERLEPRLMLADVSAPVILQYFEGSYATMERRLGDVFLAGYGAIYTPPPGRADLGDFSVGYDVYDRFDLGAPGKPTLYGTRLGLETLVAMTHRMGAAYYIDYVINHNGFSDLGTNCDGRSFAEAGGYPGFLLTASFDVDGDFHGAFEGGDIRGRLAGLIDIAHEKNYQFIRSPVPGFANNLPAGVQEACGRIANVPDEAHRALYPDRDLPPIFVFDPRTGEQNIAIYPFNLSEPLAGDPVEENAMGLLMRYAQWMVQVIGVDGFRIDAAKHVEPWVLDYFDRAVYRSSFRTQLDGSQPQVFSFSEVFDGNRDFLQQFVRKDIDTSDPGRVGGNRDVLDFPLFFAMRDNLSGNGLANDWRNVVNASQDAHDDGLANNGSQAVAFVGSHDEPGPYLSNVAHAYVLLRPGNAVVYFNAKEFGGGRDFPKDGRGDALGGLYGDVLTTLVGIRTSHGRGNYIERWLEKEMLIYEREGSALVVLSNRLDGGFDSRTVQTSFAPGTPLIELTGNAEDPVVDPFNDFPELLVVQADGTVNLRVPRNTSPAGVEHGRGYLIYGPAPPQGSLVLEGVAQQIASDIPTPETNGTARLTPWDVITADQFTVRLDTVPVNLLGFHRDRPADGDNALLRLDAGRDLNSNGSVDFVTPGHVAYGFEQFTTLHQPGYLDPNGVGAYAQVIDATLLEEGPHFLTVRAFRHREPGEGEAIFADFKRALYVDRLPPQSAVASFAPLQQGVHENRRLEVRSLDLTADNVHVFLDLPAALSDAEILAMLGPDSQTARRDRDRFAKDVFGITSGNHVATVVTFEITGNYSIQRVPGLFTSTIFGAGLGDLDFDGDYDTADVSAFGDVLFSHNTQFNPAADFTADGLVDLADLTALGTRLGEVGAGQDALAAWQALVDSVTLQLIVAPSSLAEDAGAAAALLTVSRNLAYESGELVVLLAASDTTEAAVPILITIPAGQASGTAAVDILDDYEFDGTQVVVLTANAAGYYSGQTSLQVVDNEPGTAALTDSQGDPDDARVQFGTPLSQYRQRVADSPFVRTTLPDARHYFEVRNTGSGAVLLQEIQIQVPDVHAVPMLGADPSDDILLLPGEAQRFSLTFAPTLPTADNVQGIDFDRADALVLHLVAGNTTEFAVALAGRSTFAADITYNGRVNLAELGVLNARFGRRAGDADWDPTADINGDGRINLGDLGLFNAEFGLVLGGGAAGQAGASAAGSTGTKAAAGNSSGLAGRQAAGALRAAAGGAAGDGSREEFRRQRPADSLPLGLGSTGLPLPSAAASSAQNGAQPIAGVSADTRARSANVGSARGTTTAEGARGSSLVIPTDKSTTAAATARSARSGARQTVGGRQAESSQDVRDPHHWRDLFFAELGRSW